MDMRTVSREICWYGNSMAGWTIDDKMVKDGGSKSERWSTLILLQMTDLNRYAQAIKHLKAVVGNFDLKSGDYANNRGKEIPTARNQENGF